MDRPDPLDGYQPDTWTLADITVEGTTVDDLHTVTHWYGDTSRPYPSALIGTPA